MQCREFKELADSYLSDELLVETNHEFLAHLESCAECRRELAARRELRARLRNAFVASSDLQINPAFALRLRADLRASTSPNNRTSASVFGQMKVLALAMSLVLVAIVGFYVVRQRQTSQLVQTLTNNQQMDTTAMYILNAELAREAVGDHRFCALDFQLTEEPIDLAEAGRKYDRAYINLAKAVMSNQDEKTGELKFVEAHSCVYQGQRFAHIVLKRQGRLISVLVAENADAKAVTKRTVDLVTQQAIACSQIEGYQVSCFATQKHAIFVVSDLSETDNLNVARGLIASVSAHITRAENAA